MVVLILQPISGFIGYNYVVPPNTTCLTQYLLSKLYAAKSIFSVGYTCLIVSFITGIIAFVIILHSVINFFKDKKD